MCPGVIFLVITNEQTLVNKSSSQPDDHLLTPENSIKPLVVSQQPLLTRLSKGYKLQTDCSSSSSPISDIGNEIGVSNYHPASNDLASSQYEFWNNYDQADLDNFDEIDAQYALRTESGLLISGSFTSKNHQGPFPYSSISLSQGLSRDSQGTVDEGKKQIELGLLGSSKGRIQLVVLMNLHLKFRNKERTKEIQDLSQSLDMSNDDSREKQEGTH
ncbi:hypothetical protein BY996DRAFT_8514898 [Phakopsora pachyrhizi]|nr:hypothetical protein BY996DRAFT_8514898 [Phakopsora pachyrhizi]